MTVFLDPTSERRLAEMTRQQRPTDVSGKTIGLLDISKARGNIYLDRIADLLVERGAVVKRYIKPTFTKPAPVDIRHEIATQCEIVIEGLAD